MTRVLLFLLGAYLSMRVIAALYRVLDLWYTIRAAWPQVLRGLVVWVGGTSAVGAALPGELRVAFVWGAAAFAGFFLATGGLVCYVIAPLVAARLRR